MTAETVGTHVGPRDVYFSADVETDGPIPGPYSMLALGIVLAGTYDGVTFTRPRGRAPSFYAELQPISSRFDPATLAVSGLDRDRLVETGRDPSAVMTECAKWIGEQAGGGAPVLVAQPVAFDWTWLYWYFMNFLESSPFGHSSCFDVKTAFAVKSGLPVASSGRSSMPLHLRSQLVHTHNALDDAHEQADMFANVFRWNMHQANLGDAE